MDKFKKAAGIGHLHRIRVSRKEAVDAGLIKDGIKSIAYLAADDQKGVGGLRSHGAGRWLGHAQRHQAGFTDGRHWPGAVDVGAGGQQQHGGRRSADPPGGHGRAGVKNCLVHGG
ncbi:MAG: hypothetical protein V9G23_06970 [Giesbergeria sp.]